MQLERKKVSTGLFGLAVICFFLPFTTVSCAGMEVITFSGTPLVTGTTVNITGESQRIDPSPFVIAALVAAVVDLGVSLANQRVLPAKDTCS